MTVRLAKMLRLLFSTSNLTHRRRLLLRIYTETYNGDTTDFAGLSNDFATEPHGIQCSLV
jgi:hypothetical protein